MPNIYPPIPSPPPYTGHTSSPIIDLTQEQEIRFWTARFSCTEQELRTAIAIAGPMILSVWRYLTP